MARKALIRESDGVVVNVIEVDASYNPPDGYAVETPSEFDASPGDTWNGSEYIPASEPTLDSFTEARNRALEAIKANKDTEPWGPILYDLALADGRIEIT